MRTYLSIFILAVLSTSCTGLVNTFAFHPDTENFYPDEKMPLNTNQVFITTADGIKLESYFLSNPLSDRVLIYFHGNAGNISHRIPDLARIRQFGINVLGVGYRGYGRSEGNASENGIYIDGKSALRYAIDTLGFPQDKIFIMGRSIGSTVAMNTSGAEPIAGMILVSPLTTAKDQAKAGGLWIISPLAGDAFNNVGKAKHLLCPVLILHGTEDEIIPLGMGKTLFNSIPSEKQFIEIFGAGHNNLTSEEYQEKYWSPIEQFIQSKGTNDKLNVRGERIPIESLQATALLHSENALILRFR